MLDPALANIDYLRLKIIMIRSTDRMRFVALASDNRLVDIDSGATRLIGLVSVGLAWGHAYPCVSSSLAKPRWLDAAFVQAAYGYQAVR